MSEPIQFSTMNAVLKAPQGEAEKVKSLPVWRGDDVIVSCWKLTWREWLVALLTGHIWLWVMSQTTQPPVYVTSREPEWEEPDHE